jgi:hypothetical protein
MFATGSGFDFPAFKQAFTSQDVESWISFYASDAEWIEYRHTHPPRAPDRMVGQRDIKIFLEHVKNSSVTLSISGEVIGSTHASFCVICTLSDGMRRIIEHVFIHYRGNKITRQVNVEAWIDARSNNRSRHALSFHPCTLPAKLYSRHK